MLLVFDKSYHDSTNNEKSSQSIIVFIVYLLPRNFKHGIGLLLRILYYGFIILAAEIRFQLQQDIATENRTCG